MSVGELVVSIIGDMKTLSQAFTKVQKEIGDVGTKFKAAGAQMSSAGSAMTSAVTVPIAAIVGSGALLVNWASDVEKSQGQLRASLGLTAEEAERLEETSISVWKNGYGESLDEVNAGIVSIRHNMAGLADNELESVTTGALTIAQVFEQDVDEVTAAAGVLMKNFGISGTEALDTITVGFQKGGDFSGELLDTLREYGPQFASIGLSSEEFLSTLIAGAQAGAWNLDKVGDAVKEFNVRAQDGSDTTAAGFEAIGLNAADMGAKIAAGGDAAKEAYIATVTALMAMDDPMQQNIAGVALFGTQWEDVRSQVIEASAAQIESIKDVSGATAAVTKEMDDSNPMLALTTAMRELQAAMLPVVQDQLIPLVQNDLLPILTDTLVPFLRDAVIPVLSLLLQGFAALPEPIQLLIIGATALVAALGPVLMIVGSVSSGIGALAGLFGAGGALAGAGAVISGLIAGLTALAGPILIVVAAAAAFYYGFTHWEEISEIVSDVLGFIEDALEDVWGYFTGLDMAEKGGDMFREFVDGITAVLRNQPKQIIQQTLTAVWHYLTSFSLVQPGQNLIVTLAQGIATVATLPMRMFLDALNQISQAIFGFDLYDAGEQLISSFSSGVFDTLSKLYDSVMEKVNSIKSLLTGASSTSSSSSSSKSSSSSGLTSVSKSASNTAVKTASSSVLSAVSSVASSAVDAGASLMSNIASGITSSASTVYNAVSSALSSVSNLLPHSPAKEGPLAELPNWDALFAAPAETSLENMQSSVQAGLQNVSQVINNTTSQATTQNNYGGNTINLGPNTIGSEMDLERIFEYVSKQLASQKRARGS
ncbi:phage tail tape measure protein [Methanosarcina acetivorans]|nr:phage tail tape measure protein [Methanosarcina acetivorans]